MENNQRPEWFELAENDQPTSRPLKKKKSAPMRSLTFIVAGILVIPMGAGVALLKHEVQPVSGAETLNLTQDSPAATSPAQIQPSSAITMPTVSRDDDEDDDDRAPVFTSASISPTVLAPIAPAVKAPAAITPPGSTSTDLILPPTKKAGDDYDEDDEDEDDDDDDDDDDEEDDD